VGFYRPRNAPKEVSRPVLLSIPYVILLSLHDQLDINGRGELMVLDTQNDRTIFFDLLPFYLLAPSGLKIKVKVYTVPGQVQHDVTRKAVLDRAGGMALPLLPIRKYPNQQTMLRVFATWSKILPLSAFRL